MTDEKKLSRRYFLRNVLLAGALGIVGAEDAEAKTRHRRRRKHSHGSHVPHVARHPSNSVAQPPADPLGLLRSTTPVRVGGGGGGGGGGGSGHGGWSDRRLKRAIRRIGTSPSGLPVYSFQYVWGGPRFEGAMAQDLVRLRPDAVIRDASGYMKVDYSRIDVEMRQVGQRRAA